MFKSNFFKLLIFTVFCFSIPSVAIAAPNLTSVVYDVESQQFFILGSLFGEKTQTSPVQWDNFEGGVDGATVSSPVIGTSWGNTGGTTYTSSVTRLNSNFSSRHDFVSGNNYNQALVKTGGPWRSLYISFYYRTDYGSLSAYLDDPCRNYKVVRFEGDSGTKTGDQGIGVPIVSYEKRASSSSAGIFETALRADYNVTAGSGTFYGGNHERTPIQWAHQEWHRVEFYMNVNTGEKEFFMWEDAVHNNPSKSSNGWTVTYEPLMGSDNSSFNELTFGTYFSRDNGASAITYMDDIYVDTTMARVELGNASTWAACTHREIQIASVWSDLSITSTVNAGNFKSGDTAYLYVVDVNGEVNDIGYPVVIGESGGAIIIPPPPVVPIIISPPPVVRIE